MRLPSPFPPTSFVGFAEWAQVNAYTAKIELLIHMTQWHYNAWKFWREGKIDWRERNRILALTIPYLHGELAELEGEDNGSRN